MRGGSKELDLNSFQLSASDPPDAAEWVCQTCKFHQGHLRCRLKKLIVVGGGPLKHCSSYQPQIEN